MTENNNSLDARAESVLREAFPGLEDSELNALLHEVHTKTYPPEHVLCHEGEIEHTFYIMIEGHAIVTARMANGTERQLSERNAGQFFGEMALIENRPRTATVKTDTEATVIEISENVFDQILERNANVAITILRDLTANLRASDKASIAELSRQNYELEQAYQYLKEAQVELVAKERLERELEIAGEVQRSLLPEKFPIAAGWSFAGKNEPARVVGGDLFDVIKLDDEHVGLLIADVSDKSVHAALFMGVTRALFHSESKRRLSPRETALAVHEAMFQVSSNQDMFVTVFYGVLHIETGRMRYIRAGHDYPALIRGNDGGLIELNAAGRFLGMIEELELEERDLVLEAGDLLVLYSDGVPDAVDWDERPYGMERFHKLILEHQTDTADEVCTAIYEDVLEHRGDAPAADDITLLITKSTR